MILKSFKMYSRPYFLIYTFGPSSKEKRVKAKYIIKYDKARLSKEIIKSKEFKKAEKEYFKDLIVISYNEIESNVELQSVGMVTV